MSEQWMGGEESSDIVVDVQKAEQNEHKRIKEDKVKVVIYLLRWCEGEEGAVKP